MVWLSLLHIGCESQTQSDARAVDSASAAAPAGTAVAPPARTAAIPDQDSLRAVIDSLEAVLTRADSKDEPGVLLALGRAKQSYAPEGGSHHEAFAKARPKEFRHFSPGDRWFYTGYDLEQLIERFPNSDLADDAAYELTLVPNASECEGYVPCFVDVDTRVLWPFLEKFPTSPFAKRVVDRVLKAYEALNQVADLKQADDFYLPVDGREVILRLDSISQTLPSPYRERLGARAAELKQRL